MILSYKDMFMDLFLFLNYFDISIIRLEYLPFRENKRKEGEKKNLWESYDCICNIKII